MRSHRIPGKSLIVAVLLSLAASPARPDSSLGSSSQSKKLCYCECDHAAGAPICHHMCELPKYEHRSWATTCHPSHSDEIIQTSPAPASPSKRTNRTEHARLNK